MQSEDIEAMADMVVLTIKNALAPVKAKQLALESEVSGLRQERATLLERITVLEVKSAQPVPEPDLRGLTERLVAVEVRTAGPSAHEALVGATQEIGLLRERVGVMEVKAAQPAAEPNLSAVIDRLDAVEGRIPEPTILDGVAKALTGLETRVAVVETKASIPPPVIPAPPSDSDALIDLRARVASLEATAQTDATASELAHARERIAVLETRAPVPGPAGKDGVDGRDGINGKDGADGLGFDDMDFEADEYGRMSLKFVRGDVVKRVPLAGIVDRGVFRAGEQYQPGDAATFGGGVWIAQTATTDKPGESKSWRLAVKAGRDGRDARPGRTGYPVVSSNG